MIAADDQQSAFQLCTRLSRTCSHPTACMPTTNGRAARYSSGSGGACAESRSRRARRRWRACSAAACRGCARTSTSPTPATSYSATPARWPRGHRVEAARLALPQRPLARLARVKEPGGPGGETGSGRRLGTVMPGLCIMIAGVALLGCGDAMTYTLYRNSPIIPDARLHVATFRFRRWRAIQQRELPSSARPVSAAAGR